MKVLKELCQGLEPYIHSDDGQQILQAIKDRITTLEEIQKAESQVDDQYQRSVANLKAAEQKMLQLKAAKVQCKVLIRSLEEFLKVEHDSDTNGNPLV